MPASIAIKDNQVDYIETMRRFALNNDSDSRTFMFLQMMDEYRFMCERLDAAKALNKTYESYIETYRKQIAELQEKVGTEDVPY